MNPSENVTIKDKGFFDSFFRRNYQSLCYFAYSFLKEKEISEDIVQNIFIKILNDPAVYSSENHLKYYIYKAIRNECINELKKTAIRTDVLEKIAVSLTDKDDADIFQRIVRVEIYKEIVDAINGLPSQCGRIFRLAYIENLGNSEISEMLSISVNTVKAQKNNAKKQLRENLKHLYPIAVILFSL